MVTIQLGPIIYYLWLMHYHYLLMRYLLIFIYVYFML